MPKVLAIVLCKRHQKGNSPEAEENRPADTEAKTVATRPVGPPQHLLTVVPYPKLPLSQDKGATRNQLK